MDLSHPLSTLAPTLEAEALTVLAGTEGALTGRRVAELARRGSHASITQALNRLVHQGLVSMELAGRAHLYRLNRDHLLAPLVLSAVAVPAVLQERLSGVIGDWPIRCRHASLYGSLARGEAGPDSDIDLLVLRPDDLMDHQQDQWTDQIAALEELVWEWTGNAASVLDITEDDLARATTAGEGLIESWREDSITLAGEALGALLRRAAHLAASA